MAAFDDDDAEAQPDPPAEAQADGDGSGWFSVIEPGLGIDAKRRAPGRRAAERIWSEMSASLAAEQARQDRAEKGDTR